MSKASNTPITATAAPTPGLPSTSRRRLFAGAGLAAIAAAIALPASVASPTSPNHPDAALLATCATFASLTATIHRMNAATTCDWDELTETNADWHDTLEDLSDMRPVTLAGAQAKAQAVIAAFQLDVAKRSRFNGRGPRRTARLCSVAPASRRACARNGRMSRRALTRAPDPHAASPVAIADAAGICSARWAPCCC